MIKINAKLIFFFFLGDYTGYNFHYHFMLTICWDHFGPTYCSPQPTFLLCWVETKPVNHRYFLFLISYQYRRIPFHPNQHGVNTFLTLKESKNLSQKAEKSFWAERAEHCIVLKWKQLLVKEKPQTAFQGGTPDPSFLLQDFSLLQSGCFSPNPVSVPVSSPLILLCFTFFWQSYCQSLLS